MLFNVTKQCIDDSRHRIGKQTYPERHCVDRQTARWRCVNECGDAKVQRVGSGIRRQLSDRGRPRVRLVRLRRSSLIDRSMYSSQYHEWWRLWASSIRSDDLLFVSSRKSARVGQFVDDAVVACRFVNCWDFCFWLWFKRQTNKLTNSALAKAYHRLPIGAKITFLVLECMAINFRVSGICIVAIQR